MQIELVDITKKYNADSAPVLDGITIKIAEGSTIAITGPSGSGKSTLLNLIGTLDRPTSGKVLLDGRDVSVLTEAELAKTRNHSIGFVFQNHMLLPQLTAIENISVPLLGQSKEQQERSLSRAIEMLDLVGLSAKKDSFPNEMSIGECQRVAVVRALINEPGIILADEPTGSLDNNSARNLIDMLLQLREKKAFTLLAVTHSAEVASRMEFCYNLINGKLEKTNKKNQE
ncbi:MAG: ABC transporter ATP-binding protein [Bacteroidales bacterium]